MVKNSESYFIVTPDERENLACAGDRMPLGALYVGTHYKNKGEDVSLIDLNHTSEDELLNKIKLEKPDKVGFSFTSSPIYSRHKKLLNKIYSTFPNIEAIVGGYITRINPELFQDYKIDGEDYYKQVCVVDRTLLDSDKYNMQQMGKRASTLMTSMGCPFDCTFCGNIDRRVNYKPAGCTKQDLLNIKAQGYEFVYLLDDAFTVNKKHIKATCDVLKEVGLPYRATTRTDILSDDKIRLLADSGCEIVSLGLESGNQEILERTNKKNSIVNHHKAIKLLHKHGIKSKGFFIIGLPGETKKTAHQTIDFACSMRQYGLVTADFYALTPFPGSAIHKNPEKYGIKILSHDWSKYLQAGKELVDPVIDTEFLKSHEIKDLIKIANDKFYGVEK